MIAIPGRLTGLKVNKGSFDERGNNLFPLSSNDPNYGGARLADDSRWIPDVSKPHAYTL